METNEVDISILDNSNVDNFDIVDDQNKITPIQKDLITDPPLILISTEEQKLLTKRRIHIQQYLYYFNEELSAFKNVDITQMNVEQLYDLKQQFDEILNSISPVHYIKDFSDVALPVYEDILSKKGFDIKGFSNKLAIDPYYDKNLKHLALQFFDVTTISPEKRVFMYILKTTMETHNINKIINSEQNINDVNSNIEFNIL